VRKEHWDDHTASLKLFVTMAEQIGNFASPAPWAYGILNSWKISGVCWGVGGQNEELSLPS